ncbi:hypothetical protein SNE40_011964 [Patella caerulea]|uniref:CBM20 domain-containing protein n=1 Tax=Patella caerulea TaxID=87958 RepID=A0AAN8PMH3_PATCE
MPDQLIIRFILHRFKGEDFENGEPAIVYQTKLKKERWKLKDTKMAYKNFDDPTTWYATVRILEDSEIQWMWVLITPERKIIRTESISYRHVGVGFVGGDIHSSWGISEVIYQQQGCYVNLETCYRTKLGERLAAVGAGTVLGDWTACEAPLADLISDFDWKWRVRLWMDHYTNKEWKWVVVDQRRCPVRWEDSPNRQLVCKKLTMQTIFAPWNNPGDDTVKCIIADELRDRVREHGILQLEKSNKLFQSEDMDDKITQRKE